jgi:hypothetical protein
MAATPAERRVIVLEGPPGPWLPPGFDIVRQRSGGLDSRLAGAFDDAGAPSLLIGMDTPQVTPALLGDAADRLGRPHVDAVLGLAADGGWWAIGLRRADPDVFLGVPMSTERTGERQLARLRSRQLRIDLLPQLVDVDHFDDAVAVAAAMPPSAFADRVAAVRQSVEARSAEDT